jgi:hypothetical protein
MINGGLPEFFKIVDASAGPVTSNGGVTCDYVSLKNVHRAWIVASFTQAVGHATVISPKQASAVAGTGVKALTAAGPGWFNEDTAASDTLVAQTAATTYTVTNDVKKKMVICEIVPGQNMDINGGFDVLGCTISNSSQASNFVSVVYILETRYPSATPPAAITD